MSEEEVPDAEWNPALESIIKKEGEHAQSFFWLHDRATRWAARRNDFLQIPSIILASVTGFLSATSELLPPVAIGALTLTVGVLGTLNSYYRFSQRSEGHRITAQLYLKLYKNLEVELSLPREQRTPAEALLKDLRDKMSKISETAPQLPEAVKDAYRQSFKEPATAVPIVVNGLDPIAIFSGGPGGPRSPPIKITVMDSPAPAATPSRSRQGQTPPLVSRPTAAASV